VLLTGGVLAAVGATVGLQRLDNHQLPSVGVVAAAFFVASLVHVPIGPANAHLVLNGLAGALLGLGAFPAILVALLLQAVLFQYGGLTSLGVNVCNMALPAVACGLAFRHVAHAAPSWRFPAAVACGALSVLAAGVLTAASLAFTDQGFWAAATAILVAHLPIMVVEGLITGLIVNYLAKVKPEILGGLG
jgi:cobalt/nickel transport system permease protein